MAAKANGVGVTAGGRDFPSVGCAAAWAQHVLCKEDQRREMPVFEAGVAVYVVETEGDGVVLTRRAEA